MYFPGISPTLTFASLSVRPLFISLIETYLPELEPAAIRPALKAIILALLPGLEEEASEDFEPTLRTLNKIRSLTSQLDNSRGLGANSGGQYFWQCLFLASITNPSRRLGVLAYLNRHLPKLGITDAKVARPEKGETPDILTDSMAIANSVISPEPGLLIRCFASGLADDQLLVQRNFLDLLVTNLPLHSPMLLSKIARHDFERLVIAAAGVVARRDMSLNRRLWAWFLGPEPANATIDSPNPNSEKPNAMVTDGQDQTQSQYFSRFGLDPLVRGLLKMINQNSALPTERSRPLRIALSLMDRWEVGGFVVPAVFLPVMRSVQEFERAAPKPHFDEVFRSASAFFDGVESSLIFSELLYLVDLDLNDLRLNHEKKLDNLKLAHFILANFNVREEEMLMIHVPLLVLAILAKTNQMVSLNPHKEDSVSGRPIIQRLIKLLSLLVGFVPERAFARNTASDGHTSGQLSATAATETDISKSIHEFYDQGKESLDLPPLPFSPRILSELVLHEAHQLSMSALKTPESEILTKDILNLLISLLKKTPKSGILADNSLYTAFYENLCLDDLPLNTHTFAIISSITATTTTLYNISGPGYYVTYQQMNDLVPILVRHLWAFLSSKSPKFHVEAVRCLWLLHSISWKDHLVEASITSLMIGPSSSSLHQVSNIENAERFFVLWNHSHHWTYDSSSMRVAEESALNGKSSGQDRSLYQLSLLQRPLFIILDLLSKDVDEASQSAREWLQDLPSIQK